MNITIISNDGYEHVFNDKSEYGIEAIFILMSFYDMTQITLPNHVKEIEKSVSISLTLNSK